jgi:hypothetical protein
MGAGSSFHEALPRDGEVPLPPIVAPGVPVSAVPVPAPAYQAGDRKRSLTGLVGLPMSESKPTPGARRGSAQHVQEEAASFRSKSSSIKMMMRNQAYRKCFFNFLENTHNGKEEMMDFFLLVETLKKTKEKEAKRSQFMEAVEKYEKKAMGKPTDAPETIISNSMHHWKGVVNLTDEELAKHIERSQDDILLALTPLFETFLVSTFFQQVKDAESRDEKRRFSRTSV